MTVIITPETLKGIRFVAGDDCTGPVEMSPELVLALLDRIDGLEDLHAAHQNIERAALEQLAHALGWKDGGPGWQAAIDAVAAQKDRIEALESFLRRIHGQKDAAVLNQAIWRFLNPNPPASALSDPDPDE